MNAKIACPDCSLPITLDDMDVAADIARCRKCERNFGLADLFRRRDMPGSSAALTPKGAWHRKAQSGFEIGASMRSWRSGFFFIFTSVMIGMVIGFRLGGFPAFLLLMMGAGCLALATLSLALVAGSVRVRVEGDQGVVAVGFWVLSLTRKFRWSAVTHARRVDSNTVENGVRLTAIELAGAEGTPQFGSWLTPDRFEFVLIALQNEIHARRRQSGRRDK